MRNALTVGLAATALTALLTAAVGLAAASDARSEPAADVCVCVTPDPDAASSYVRGPRIIHVPRSDEKWGRAEPRDGAPRGASTGASIIRRDGVGLADESYCFDDGRPRRPHHTLGHRLSGERKAKAFNGKSLKRSAAREPASTPLPKAAPRAKLPSDAPLTDGPTPIRPTPNFGAKAIPELAVKPPAAALTAPAAKSETGPEGKPDSKSEPKSAAKPDVKLDAEPPTERKEKPPAEPPTDI